MFISISVFVGHICYPFCQFFFWFHWFENGVETGMNWIIGLFVNKETMKNISKDP